MVYLAWLEVWLWIECGEAKDVVSLQSFEIFEEDLRLKERANV